MPVVRQIVAAYFTPMALFILRLFTLIALVLLPFGMNASMAAAPSDHAPVAMTQHCGEHGSKTADKTAKQLVECTVACSALLAAETIFAEPPPTVRLPPAQLPVELVTGFQPDTATPPPKLS